MVKVLEEFMAMYLDPESKREDLEGKAKEVVEESQAKDSRIEELEKELKDVNEKYDKLKDRTMEALFSNSKGQPEPVIEKQPEPKPKKTFNDLVDQDAPWKI